MLFVQAQNSIVHGPLHCDGFVCGWSVRWGVRLVVKIWAILSVVTISNDDVATVAITIKVYVATLVVAAAADVAGGFVATAVVAGVTMLTLLLRDTLAVTITITTTTLVVIPIVTARVFSGGCNDNHYCYHQRCRCYYNH